MRKRLRAAKRFGWLVCYPKCGLAFAGLAVLGAALGHAVGEAVYTAAWEALFMRLPTCLPPESVPAGTLLTGLLVPALFGACMGICGYSSRLWPLWGAAILLSGTVTGMRLSAAACLLTYDGGALAGAATLLFAILPVVLQLRLSLLVPDRLACMREPFFEEQNDGYATAVLGYTTALLLLDLALGTASCLIGLHSLFH